MPDALSLKVRGICFSFHVLALSLCFPRDQSGNPFGLDSCIEEGRCPNLEPVYATPGVWKVQGKVIRANRCAPRDVGSQSQQSHLKSQSQQS